MTLYNLKYIKRTEYFDKYSHQKKNKPQNTYKQNDTRKFVEVIHMFSILIVVMVLQVCFSPNSSKCIH